ncbi:ATP-binding protein [Cronobacter sakazakii]|uniref:ATP-binding protein n=1 Tax=Cronobacter sakazakii TaxID=28141 RepID=UPI000BE9413C|nr:ATP-binding protein [Cronobacter sakazakii]MDK1263597.1 ATP-binding protein [Cronobacter sakazakii]MDK1414673.1 ATP-binding protein [Cronobacter sakazakii]PUV43739.1 ATP-binding protein [Cronobacter sakazakii]HDU8021402.1 ATP-binding protein [Cronobacter sakazakii]
MSKITVKAGADHLADLACAKPVTAISELIWNGFDAKSSRIEVIINKNPLGEGIDAIFIKDSGTGIIFDKVTDYFGNLGESWKKRAKLEGDRSLHGQYGRGRFKALSLGGKVVWRTVYEKNDKLYEYTISTDANRINDFTITDPQEVIFGKKGTTVEIYNVDSKVSYLLSDEAILDITLEFALFLTEYPLRQLIVNGESISPEQAWQDKKDYIIGSLELQNQDNVNVSLTIIEWAKKVNREIYYCDSNGFSFFKEKLGQLIRAPGYDFTLYAKCDYFKKMSESNELSLGDLVPEIKIIKDAIIQQARMHFIDKAFVKKSLIVESWKEQDIYPYHEDDYFDAARNVERKVFDILAVNVQSYLKNFESSDKKTKKFTFMLLAQAIKQNPASVQRIISEVLGLKTCEQDELAELLERTTLSSIISASKIVSDRINFLNALDNLVHDRETKDSFLERDQLHKILEKEAWVFRDDFYLAGSEDRLETVLKKHLKHLGKRFDEEEYMEPVILPGGKRGRVDLMFAKCRQPYEGFTEYLVVELKRPSQKIDYDVVGQIEKYAMSVCSDERFDHANSKWTFIAVSNSMDDFAARKARTRGWPKGKTMDDAEFNVEVWIMTWAEVINAARAKLSFFSRQLNYEATRDSAISYLEKTHKDFIPVLPEKEESA